MNEMVKENTREDRIRISEEVIATIAGIAASENESLASMSGGFVDGIAGNAWQKNSGQGHKGRN